MNAHTATVAVTSGEAPPEVAMSKGELVRLAPPRLPYHPAVEERFGVDRAGWNALVGAIFPSARSAESIVMALSYCRARKLDVFKRPVHIVPMWSSAVGAMVETVWPGISELRTTAFRTGQYAGMAEPEFGPVIEQTFEGVSDKGRTKGQKRTLPLKFPEWCRITITRELGGKERRFVGPKVYWLETYAKWADTDVPNDMWAHRGVGQLEKCAEAAALRRAFPEEIGNDYAAEEMEGRRLVEGQPEAVAMAEPPTPTAAEPAGAVVEPPTEVAGSPAASAAADALRAAEPEVTAGNAHDKDGVVWEEEGERAATANDVPEPPSPDAPAIDKTEDANGTPAFLQRKPVSPPEPAKVEPKAAAPKVEPKPAAKAEPKKAEPEPFDVAQWLKDLEGACDGCETLDQLIDVQAKVQVPARKLITSKTDWEKGKTLVLAASGRILGDSSDEAE